MKLCGLILAALFFAAGCSSDDDDNNAPLNDQGAATDGVNTDGSTGEETNTEGTDTEGTDTEGSTTEGTNTDGETPTTSTVLDRNNYIEIIAQALGIYASQPMRNSVYEPFEAIENQEADSSQFNQENSINSSLYSCSNGGTATGEVLDASATGYSRFAFTNCQVGDSIYDGVAQFNRTEGQSTQRVFLLYSANNRSESSSVLFEGSVIQTNYVCRTDNYQSWSTTDFNWQSVNSNDESTFISQANTSFSAGTNCGAPWKAKMNGSFSIESPLSNGQTLAVSISPEMISNVPDNTNFQTGTMEISSTSDESKIIFNADNADSESVSISIVNSAGTETFDEPWTTWEGILVVKGTGK